MVCRPSAVNFKRLSGFKGKIESFQDDLLDQTPLISSLEPFGAQEVQGFVSHSSARASWNQTMLTCEFTAAGVIRILDHVRTVNPRNSFWQILSSLGSPLQGIYALGWG